MEKPTYEDLFEKEFNLSEKIFPRKDSIFDKAEWFLKPKDVKEFIRLLKGYNEQMDKKIDKLAGEKLI